MSQTMSATSVAAAARASDQQAVEVVDLRKTYRGKGGDVEAVKGVSFAVAPGTILALLGPNGAGKSTTLRICTTLSRPTSGRVRVFGVDVAAEPQRARRLIGVVAQRSGVDPEATGRENLELQGRLYGLSGAALRGRVDELLQRFGLAHAAGRQVGTYSGGMQRRLDIALGLVHRPRVLFLDEPTTGLDPDIRVAMWREIAALTDDEGLTVVLTTHYLEEADALAERLAILDGGSIVAAGTSADLKARLRGDAVTVELGDADAAARAADLLQTVAGVSDITTDGTTVHSRVSDGATAVPAVVAALDGAGLPPASIQVARPSLSDVYLSATGHVYADGTSPT